MIKARKISYSKLIVIIFSILLPVNFFVMIIVGWQDEGAMADGTLVHICRSVLNVLLYPLHAGERLFETEASSGLLFFTFDVVCIALWGLLVVGVFKLVNQQLPKPAKRRG
jgi:hypothetical protein